MKIFRVLSCFFVVKKEFLRYSVSLNVYKKVRFSAKSSITKKRQRSRVPGVRKQAVKKRKAKGHQAILATLAARRCFLRSALFE